MRGLRRPASSLLARVPHRCEGSRRHFLGNLGFGAGGILAAGLLFDSQPGEAQVCKPVGRPGRPKPWVHDLRPRRDRRPASALTQSEVDKVRLAYRRMRDLSKDDPGDPRSLSRQAKTHCWHCGGYQGPENVHASWQFLTWHRAYLYFHERTLGSLIGDPDFRLPYWDWDHALGLKLPQPYLNPATGDNALWDDRREADELLSEDVASLETAMSATTFRDFGGTAESGGWLQRGPHDAVHQRVGGAMALASTSGEDPLFFAHHANVDRLWSEWTRVSPARRTPTDSKLLNIRFSFYDEQKAWRSIGVTQLLDHERALAYGYSPSPPTPILPPLDWQARPPLKFAIPFTLDPATLLALGNAVASRAEVRLHFQDAEVPTAASTIYRVYANRVEAEADQGPESPGYLGTMPVWLDDKDGTLPSNSRREVVFLLTKRLVRLLQLPPAWEVTLVERKRSGAKGTVTPFRARSVEFALAPQPL